VSVEEIGVVEDLATPREARSRAAVSPVGADPLTTAAGHMHELHGGKGTSPPRLSYQLEGRIVVNEFVWQPVIRYPGLGLSISEASIALTIDRARRSTSSGSPRSPTW
jgi:hypothetical protein